AQSQANTTRPGAAGVLRGQRPVAVGRPAEAGYSRGAKPSEYHKAGSRRGSQGAAPPKKGNQLSSLSPFSS
ncbi:MAG: hypothetical protein VZR34_02200, partial [Candidatus Cryptobacteroides sp.]|nr:hypothetical protein [Candidatus Cryptobacteroides sp.]